jgi:hypothetical protein
LVLENRPGLPVNKAYRYTFPPFLRLEEGCHFVIGVIGLFICELVDTLTILGISILVVESHAWLKYVDEGKASMPDR